MGKLMRFEIREMPEVRVIGKQIRYSMDAMMHGDNRIPGLWEQCFADGIFGRLEADAAQVYDPAYVGIMLDWDRGDGDFTYVCGMLMKPGAETPEGYVSYPISAAKAAVGYIQGSDVQDVCGSAHAETEKALREHGHTNANMGWCMELYNCPRFTKPDENGQIILDYYIPIDA